MFNSPNKSVGVINGVPDFPADGNDYVFQGDNTWKVLPPSAGKNVIINGNLTVDQRGVYTEYVADRWKIVDASNMTQIIEDVNFEPSTEYTLSWEGGTPQQITSPASGHWTLPNIPRTARKIQLEKGDEATDFEYEDYADTLHKCMRYYQSGKTHTIIHVNSNTGARGDIYLPYPMRNDSYAVALSNINYQAGSSSSAFNAAGDASLESTHGKNISGFNLGLSFSGVVDISKSVNSTRCDASYIVDSEL